MSTPEHLKYTASHEWARQEADGRIVSERLNVSKDGVKPPH